MSADSLYICAAHRFKLGYGWRINEKCPHRIKSNKTNVPYRVNIDLASQIVKICTISFNKDEIFYPVGTKMCIDCFEHLKKIIEKYNEIFNVNSPKVERR